MKNVLEQIASVDEMVNKWVMDARTIRRWCEDGKIEARKINGVWVVLKDQERPKHEEPAVKIKGLKKAVGEFNNWQGAARIYFDKDTKEVWTNVYASENEWDQYNDRNIVQVHEKLSLAQNRDKTSMKELQHICEMALKTEDFREALAHENDEY